MNRGKVLNHNFWAADVTDAEHAPSHDLRTEIVQKDAHVMLAAEAFEKAKAMNRASHQELRPLCGGHHLLGKDEVGQRTQTILVLDASDVAGGRGVVGI